MVRYDRFRTRSAIGWGRIAAGQPFPCDRMHRFLPEAPRFRPPCGGTLRTNIRHGVSARDGPAGRRVTGSAGMLRSWGRRRAGYVCVKDGFFASGMRGDPIPEGRGNGLPAFHAGGCLCRRKDFVAAEDRGLCRVDLLRHQLERGSALTKPQKEGAGYLAVSDPSG